MQSAIFNTPLLKVKSLEAKFDTFVLSNSFVALLDNNYIEARILQQLHYWCYSQYGVVIDGIRWIYKPLREWLTEALVGFTEWKLRVAIASLLGKGLIRREKLYVKHHELKHDNPYWHPKNQTYYYSVNYDKLQELIEEVENKENPETIENVRTSQAFEETSNDVSFRFEDSTKLSVEDFLDTKCCELSQNKTDLTSKENQSKDKSHPTLPCEWEMSKENNQGKQQLSKSELNSLKEPESKKVNYVNSQAIEQGKSFRLVEEKINQDINTNQDDVREPEEVKIEQPVAKPKPKTPKGTKPKRKGQAPWKDEGQFKRFYRALIQALPIVANAHSPQGLAQVIIRQLRSGIPHSYWDDFIAGLPIGTSTKPEWEIEPGVPYPMFVEYLTEKIKAGNNTTSDEQTRNEVFRILSQPRQTKAFWGQFKRSVVNISEQVERDHALGVTNPHTPVWTRERIEPSLSEAAAAGSKIMAVNGNAQTAIESANNSQLPSEGQITNSKQVHNSELLTSNSELSSDPWTDDDEPQSTKSQPTLRELLTKRLGKRNLKGFMKQMPKVSSEKVEAASRAEKKPKTNIAQMSIAEINDYLVDPILRKQIMPQLWHSDYEFVTNELGEVIKVRRPSSS